jgi:hypothetical protein
MGGAFRRIRMSGETPRKDEPNQPPQSAETPATTELGDDDLDVVTGGLSSTGGTSSTSSSCVSTF